MKDFVSKQWNRVAAFVASLFDAGTSTRTIWQVLDAVEAEPVRVVVTPQKPGRR